MGNLIRGGGGRAREKRRGKTERSAVVTVDLASVAGTNCCIPSIYSSECRQGGQDIMPYTVKKASGFPVPSRDATNIFLQCSFHSYLVIQPILLGGGGGNQ